MAEKSTFYNNMGRIIFPKQYDLLSKRAQSFNLPGVSWGEAQGSYKGVVSPAFKGDHATFNDLEVTFLVDSDLEVITLLWDWVTSIWNPKTGMMVSPAKGKDVDISVELINQVNRSLPIITCKLESVWPASLPDLPIELANSQAEPVPYTVMFRYMLYTIERNQPLPQ